MEPLDFLTTYPNRTLTVNSTDDARRKDFQRTVTEAYAQNCPIRYEADTRMLFVEKDWLDCEILPEDLRKLQLNTQYRGTMIIRTLKGTGYDRPPCSAYVFDTSQISARRATIDPKARRTYRNKLIRENRLISTPELARKMEAYDRMQENLHHPNMQDIETVKLLKEQTKRMLDEARRITLGMQPKVRRKKERKALKELDSYVERNLKHLIVNRKKKLADNKIPHIEEEHQEVREGQCLGVYKEEASLHSDHHSKKLYLLISSLKHHVPNYRSDLRYVTSHTVYIKERCEDGSMKARNIYCAVFDLLRR